MDREALYRNLQELETQLRGVKSATDQVKAVVASDKELAKSFDGYVQALNGQVAILKELHESGLRDIKQEAQSAINSALHTLEEFDALCNKTLADTTTKLTEENKSHLEEIKKTVSECVNQLVEDVRKKTDEVIDDISASASTLSELAKEKLPDLTARLNETVTGKLEPLVKVEMAKTLSEALVQYKAAFDACHQDLKLLSEDMTSRMTRILSDVERSGAALSTIPNQVKEQVGTIKTTLEESLKQQHQLLTDLNANMAEVKTAVLNDLAVSQQAAQDTVAAMAKLDKVADEFNGAVSKITQKVEESTQLLKDLMAKQESLNDRLTENGKRLERVEKFNILILILAVISTLAVVGPFLIKLIK